MLKNSAIAREKIENTPDLPTLPSVATEIIRVANTPTTSATDVSEIIQRDQALTTKVLKLVNSAFYGFPGKIKTIQHAVVILGFNKVKSTVMAASLFDMTKDKIGNAFDIPNFWIYSLTAAISAQATIKHIDPKSSPNDVFVAGLIHSIGSLILDQVYPLEYNSIIAKCNEEGCDIVTEEKKQLGFTHMQAGEWATEKWQLPSILRSSIRYYVTPLLTQDNIEAVVAVHIGSVIAKSLGIGSYGVDLAAPFDKKVLRKYKLNIKSIHAIVDTTLKELKLAKDFIDLIHS